MSQDQGHSSPENRAARGDSRHTQTASSVHTWLLAAAGAGVFVILAIALVVLYGGSREKQSRSVPGSDAGVSTATAMAFSLPAVDGRTVSLGDYLGSKNVLLFLNEGTM